MLTRIPDKKELWLYYTASFFTEQNKAVNIIHQVRTENQEQNTLKEQLCEDAQSDDQRTDQHVNF